MNVTDETRSSIRTHDAGLLDWFLALSVEQRLAELESRVALLSEARLSNCCKLSRDSEASQ